MLVPEAYAAPAPAGLDPIRAGAVPVAAMIAHETLRDLLDVQPDDLVLITAASGGVGHFAVQIAAHCGARVVATTSRDNRDFVSALGATMVVDYDASNLGLAIQARFPEGVNKALNLKAVGSGTGDQVAQILCEGGHMVDLTGTVSVDRPAVQIDSDYMVRGDGARLLAIAHMIDDALLDVHIHGTLPFERAPEALEMVLAGQVRGKVVLDMT
jgi:NADPH:quinone reductase-like Zn-dependent oxidoreductase